MQSHLLSNDKSTSVVKYRLNCESATSVLLFAVQSAGLFVNLHRLSPKRRIRRLQSYLLPDHSSSLLNMKVYAIYFQSHLHQFHQYHHLNQTVPSLSLLDRIEFLISISKLRINFVTNTYNV